ncbi:glycosyl transferase family group 2-domain-containing protein [Fimicolochytrium jonesii]|uniref:glycosyl transferase family group 2-domain-containing protein n=1 Tax=Fimicolochytrium jonesii TaxID=1396493 RepID=UPI0022FEEE08|nr:glycosyl transferase family group 2-domain-containing protein [Fimicolochytrium jonesii]KAI8819193.1 glycosyl transferase family group 2-domain-containing protein [Fimicolochytrium jonesii]
MSRKAGSPRKKAIPDEIPSQTYVEKPYDEWPDTSTDISSRLSSDTLAERNATAIDVAPSPKKGTIPQLPDDGERTNKGRTTLVMRLMSWGWIFHFVVILGTTYVLSFVIPQGYVTDQVWNKGCYWKMGWLLPIPYTFICFLGLILPLHNAPAPKKATATEQPRRVDNLYILTVTKGDNKEAVMRAWKAHKHLELLDPCVRVHVLTDEPNFFEGINCYTCPKSFTTSRSKYKARALEWYRQTMRYTEHDWILHLDEESVIDDESVARILEFVKWKKEYTWGQGIIMYNQYHFWKNPFYTVADGLRVGDDLSRFHLQYTYFHRPIFGAHGSFLLTNGAVENAVTWDLGSLTEDFQFAVKAWQMGFRCGSVAGIVREQSPLDLIGFLKQRRRWFVGIRRLGSVLPKLLALFWGLGLLSLYCTIASFILGVYVPTDTPMWFGILKDFSLTVFVYLYAMGMFYQNVDKGYNIFIVILLVPVTILFQFVAVIMEAVAVMFAILLPPDDFDVIKK